MKRKAVFLLALTVLLALGGCSLRIVPAETPERETTEKTETPEAPENAPDQARGKEEISTTIATIEYHTFEETVSQCTDILVGMYLGEEEAGGGRKCAFSLEERLKGGTEAETVCVYLQRAHVCATEHSGAYLSGELPFVPGTRYLLILERHRSVFYETDRYLLPGDVFLPLEGGDEARMYDEPMEKHWACPASGSGQAITAYVRELIAEGETSSPEAYGAPFIEAQSFEEAEAAAELVLRVRAEALFLTGRTAPTETWACRILDSRKGDLDYLEGNMDVLVTLPAGAAEEGREYWICVNKPDETSRIFVPVSRENGIREAEDQADRQNEGVD